MPLKKVFTNSLEENPDLDCISKYNLDVENNLLSCKDDFGDKGNKRGDLILSSYDLFRSENIQLDKVEKFIRLEKNLIADVQPKKVKDSKKEKIDSLIDKLDSFKRIIGRSEEIQKVKRDIFYVKDKNCKVLFAGESGTGKSLAANVLYQISPFSNKKLVSVNVGALQKDLIETTLFGSVKGAYTDAINRKGLMSLANGGVLFMDEIGELSLECQPQLLRALDEGVYRKVGSNEEEKVDTQFIFATNANLKDLVNKKLFREDLYWRIAEYVISIPPLRKRKEDIPLMAQKFLDDVNKKNPKNHFFFSSGAIDKLLQYGWPGNIRELKTCINISSICSITNKIEASDIKFT